MNTEYEKALEARVDRALKQLPDLPAPSTLLPRLRAAVEKQAAAPWYRQAWLAWPVPWQAVSVALLAGLLGAIWWTGAQLAPWSAGGGVLREVGHWQSSAGALWNALEVIHGTAGLLLKQLGPWFLAGLLLLLALMNALCMGLGTMCVRLAFVRPESSVFQKAI